MKTKKEGKQAKIMFFDYFQFRLCIITVRFLGVVVGADNAKNDSLGMFG